MDQERVMTSGPSDGHRSSPSGRGFVPTRQSLRTGDNDEEDNGSTVPLVLTSKEQELQKLLAEERQRSDQRKLNYQALKVEHIKLQKDFLTLQSEMKLILEETKMIKKEKESELDNLMTKCVEKDRLIESLRKELAELDPEVVKERFAEELKEPLLKLEKEKESLLRDKERLTFEIKMNKQKIEHLEKEMMDSVDRVRLAYEAEINLVRKEKEELRLKYMEASQTPDCQKLTTLTDENQKLKSKVKAYQTTLDEAQAQYRKIEAKVEALLADQEKTSENHEREVKLLTVKLDTTKEDNLNLESLLKACQREKDELLQTLTRYKREIDKHNQQINELDKRHEEEKARWKRSVLKERTDFEQEKNHLVSEIKKLRAEMEAKEDERFKLEQSLVKKDADHRIEVALVRQQEWEKTHSVERERATLDSKLKDLKEEKSKQRQEIDQLKRQLESGMELRMSLEKESLILRAKVESLQGLQEELDKLRRQHSLLHEQLSGLRSDHSETLAINKELLIQKERYKEDYNRIKLELDEERRMLSEFRILSEKNLSRLKTCLEEERKEMSDKMDVLQEELRRRRKDKDEIKAKCKEYASIVEKLQLKLRQSKSVEVVNSGNVSKEAYLELRSRYKEMKRQHNRLSELLNCSFDSKQCKPNSSVNKNDS